MSSRQGLVPLLAFLAVAAPAQQLPHPKHIVIVIEENKGYGDVIDLPGTSPDKSRAPYLNELARRGALLTNYHGLHHPSQPNYLELFSGNTQGVCNDHRPRAMVDAPNLAKSLDARGLATGRSSPDFKGFAENLTTGSRSDYVERHCPWLDFSGIPAEVNVDFSKFPQNPEGFGKLPAVAIVIPNLVDDMHSPGPSARFAKLKRLSNRHDVPAEVLQGDQWLKDYLGRYADWAMNNNSLLIVTWDEDRAEDTDDALRLELGRLDSNDQCEHAINTEPPENLIPTIIVGQPVAPGSTSATMYTHHSLLRTILDMEQLPAIGGSKTAKSISGIWQ